MSPEIQQVVHYSIPLSAALVLVVASLIIGFLLNAVTFWNVFTTKASCESCKTSAEKLSSAKETATSQRFRMLEGKLDRHSKQFEELFRYHRLVYGAITAMATRLKVSIPDEQTGLKILRMVSTEDWGIDSEEITDESDS
jgi:Flp pilus assembly protein TadB